MEITIIIPTYNREKFLSRTLESVKMQSHRPLHLILVDNNSTDNTLSVLSRFKEDNESTDFEISILSESKKGASAARNCGLAYAKSEWVMFFDSDDTMDDYHVEQLVHAIKTLDNQRDIMLVRSDFNEENGAKSIPPLRSGNLLRNHIYHSIFSTQRYIVRRDFIIKSGGWNEDLPAWNDWELGVRLLLGKPRVESLVDKIPVHVFVHEDSITGVDYSSRAANLEQAVDAVESAISKADAISNDEKAKLLTLTEFKRLTLAGLYTKEGHERGSELYKEVMKRVKKRPHCSWLFPFLYRYISFGGRGSAKIIDLLV